MKSILLAHPSNDLYGSDRMALRTAMALQRAGYAVEFVLPGGGELFAAAQAQGLSVNAVPTLVLQKRLLKPRGLILLVPHALRSLTMSLIHLRQVKPDALYVNTVTLPIWVLAGWILRIPVIVHVREAEELSIALRRVILSQLLLTRCVLANSYATRENVTSSYRSLVDRVRVLYNGMDFPVANSTAPNKPPYRIVLVGRMSPRKGQDVAISALAKLRADGVDARLDLVGDCYPGYEWYVDLLYDLAKQYDVEKDVEFRGFAEDVWPAYAAASLVMVPSRVEPFGNVAVEALAMGNPVVASDVQGLREIIQHGKTGLLIDPEDGEAVAAACKTLILDRELADRMAAAGCEDVRRRFSSERYAADIAGVLAGL